MFFFAFPHILHNSLSTAFSCFCTQIIPPFKILPTRRILPVYGIHPFIDRCHQRRNKRKKKKGTGKSLLCVLVSVSWDGLSWEDCVGLRPGTSRILTLRGWKRNAPVTERRKKRDEDGDKFGHGGKTQHVPKMVYAGSERRTGNGKQGKSNRIHRFMRRGRQL